MAPKPMERPPGCKVGLRLRRESISSGCWHPAPTARHLRHPSSTRGHREATRVSQHQVQGERYRWCPSALLQDSTRAESVLNSFTKPLSEAGSGISHLSESFHFSSLSPPCSISRLCEGLGCTSHEPLTFVEVKHSTQLSPNACLEVTLTVSLVSCGYGSGRRRCHQLFCAHDVTFGGARKGATLLLSIMRYSSNLPGFKAQTTGYLSRKAQVQRWAASGKSRSILFFERTWIVALPMTALAFWKTGFITISGPWHCSSDPASKHGSVLLLELWCPACLWWPGGRSTALPRSKGKGTAKSAVQRCFLLAVSLGSTDNPCPIHRAIIALNKYILENN